VEVTAIYNEMEEEVPSALAGDNVRMRLRGVEEEEVQIGFVLCDVRRPVHAVTQFQAQLAILDHKNIICAGYSAVLHVHTLAEEIQLTVRTSHLVKMRLTRLVGFIALLRQEDGQEIEKTTSVCQEGFVWLAALQGMLTEKQAKRSSRWSRRQRPFASKSLKTCLRWDGSLSEMKVRFFLLVTGLFDESRRQNDCNWQNYQAGWAGR
jgi:selenocysteine-specific translation elongation factor